jgi:hypothetical protein
VPVNGIMRLNGDKTGGTRGRSDQCGITIRVGGDVRSSRCDEGYYRRDFWHLGVQDVVDSKS